MTDLGTEFGVDVNKDGKTISHVFRGSVRVRALGILATDQGSGVVLHENESACVDATGAGRKAAIVSVAKSPVFVREIPKRTVRSLDLVDVVAGGAGFSGKRDRGIDPTNGQIVNALPKDFNLAGDRHYHRVTALPLVDGVFIPDGSAGPVQIDSARHTFDFPKTSNGTFGPVWTGRVVVPDNPPETWKTEIGGVDYASPGHGVLVMHANKGVTFDLDAIRRANSGIRIAQFGAVVANTEIYSQTGRTLSADVWVLVDGQARFRQREISGYSGYLTIAVPIRDGDRFLTLAATDGGNGTNCDWIMFGDPRLTIE